jgi:Uma2 family endonuclease
MTPAVAIPVEEYLRTDYEPDVDYVDGELIERNMGEKDHGLLQLEIAAWFRERRRSTRIYPFVEQRVRVTTTRYRVPDICLVVGAVPKEGIFTSPPFVAIEILSPEDRMTRVQSRIEDFLRIGVKYVWVINPESRTAWIHTQNGAVTVRDGIIRTENPEIVLDLNEIYAEINSL